MTILDPRVRAPRRRSLVPAASAAFFVLTLAAAKPVARDLTIRIPAPRSAVQPPSPAVAAPADVVPVSRTEAVQPAPALAAPADVVPVSRTDAVQALQARHDASCLSGERVTFSGTSTDKGERSLYGDWVIQERFGDLRMCLVALDGTITGNEGPTALAARAAQVVLETVRAGSTLHFEARRDGGTPQTVWRVNGVDRPFDAAAQSWRDGVLAVLDRYWEISSLHGEESSLRGEISSLLGQESSLRGQISSVRGEVSSMRGRQSSVRGDESSLRGEISSIEGQASSLRGQISSERGAISALEASRDQLNDADRQRLQAQLKSHEDAILRIERKLRDFDEAAKVAAVEHEIRDLNAAAKVAAIEDQIHSFDEAAKIAAIEKQIVELNVAGKTAAIEKRIQALDVDRRSRELQDRLDEALKRLQQTLASIK